MHYKVLIFIENKSYFSNIYQTER